MGTLRVKWIHAAGHVGSMGRRVIKRACKSEPLVIDWSEMYRNIDDLKMYGKKYNHFIGAPKRVDRRGRVVNHDVVISTHEDATVIHDEEFWVDAEIRRFLKYMPERHGKARVIEYEGERILIIAWHPQPNPLRRVKIVLPHYRRSVRRVEAKQRELETRYKPSLVLQGGDLQLPRGRRRVSPNKLAKRLGMRWKRHKIDWQMWKGEGWKFHASRTINASKINEGVDHRWMVLVLKKSR